MVVCGWLPVEVGLDPFFGLCDRNFPTLRSRYSNCAAGGISYPGRINLLVVMPGGGNFYLHIAVAKGPNDGGIVRDRKSVV